jgi:hypothetical protein
VHAPRRVSEPRGAPRVTPLRARPVHRTALWHHTLALLHTLVGIGVGVGVGVGVGIVGGVDVGVVSGVDVGVVVVAAVVRPRSVRVGRGVPRRCGVVRHGEGVGRVDRHPAGVPPPVVSGAREAVPPPTAGSAATAGPAAAADSATYFLRLDFVLRSAVFLRRVRVDACDALDLHHHPKQTLSVR